jgi:diacylglycerol O-acyltransferase / trehalose O-mycolyltransferase
MSSVVTPAKAGVQLFFFLGVFAALSACGASTQAATPIDAAARNLPPNAQFDTDANCPAPRCFDVEIPLPEGVAVTDNHVRVILPVAYGDGRLYPVLYLLHDAGGTYKIWTEQTDVLKLSRAFDAIIVMPDGGHGPDAGWYTNWLDGSRQWETFHIDVMIPYLESHLDTLGDGHRAVAGASMGGFGSMSYSARHPGLFAAAGGISGAVDLLYLQQLSAEGSALINPIISTPDASQWGDPVTNYAEWQAHDPASNIEGLRGMEIFLTSANGLVGGAYDDLTGPTAAGYYAVENLTWQMSRSLASKLEAAGIEHRTFFFGPGYHDWPYFREELVWVLPQLTSAVRPDE